MKKQENGFFFFSHFRFVLLYLFESSPFVLIVAIQSLNYI